MAEGTVLTGGMGDGASGTTGGGGNSGGGAPGASASPPPGAASGNGSGNSGGGSSATWRDSLPEDIRGNPVLGRFTDVPNLAKAYLHAQTQISKKGVIVPEANAPDEQWGEFFKGIGVPEADKYEVKAPEGTNVDANAIKWFKDQALAAGLLPRQANAMLGKYLEFEKQQVTQFQTQQAAKAKQELDALKAEWGDAFGREATAASVAVKQIGGDDFVKFLSQTKLGDNPQIIKFCAKVAKLLGEDRLREGGVNNDGAQTQAEIQAQINEIFAKGSENGYYDKNHPNHQIMVEKMASLRKQQTGGR